MGKVSVPGSVSPMLPRHRRLSEITGSISTTFTRVPLRFLLTVQGPPNRPQSLRSQVLFSSLEHIRSHALREMRPVGTKAAAGGRSRRPFCHLAGVVADDAPLIATVQDRSVDVDVRALLLRGTVAAGAGNRKKMPGKHAPTRAST